MAGERRTHRIVLCVKDYYDQTGQHLLLEAGKTYPDLEWRESPRKYDAEYGYVWNCPVIVDAPCGKIRLEKKDADDVLRAGLALEDVLYMQYYKENLTVVQPTREHPWAGLMSAHGSLGMEVAPDGSMVAEASPHPDYIRKSCYLAACAETGICRHGSLEECLEAAHFLEDVEELERERVKGEGQTARPDGIMPERILGLYRQAAEQRMEQEGIGRDDAMLAFYKNYAETGKIPGLGTEPPAQETDEPERE